MLTMVNFKTVYVGIDRRIISIKDFVSGLNPFLYQEKFGIKMYCVNANNISEEIHNNMYSYSMSTSIDNEGDEFFKRLAPTEDVEQKLKDQSKIVDIMNKFITHTMQFMSTFNTSFVTSYVDIFILNEIQEYKNNGIIGLFLNKLLEIDSDLGYDIDDVVEKYILKNEDRKRTLIQLYDQEINLVKYLSDFNFVDAELYLNRIRTVDSK
jgi:hypothetical protein